MNGQPTESRYERILGLDFFAGTVEQACTLAGKGGLVVAPAGPGLAHDLVHVPAYRAALESADLVLTDSGFLVLLWRLRTGRGVPRISGLEFLRAFLSSEASQRRIFWVMPSTEEMQRNLAWLRAHGFGTVEADCYVAPRYEGSGAITDEAIRMVVEQRHPEFVIIALGGGVQERLGAYLKSVLSYRPGIFCLGAAIAFLTGGQVGIPPWVDRWRLGWLWRIASNPPAYTPRYLRALRLGWLVFRFGRDTPESALSAPIKA